MAPPRLVSSNLTSITTGNIANIANITTLPTELLELIASHLSLDDTRALRLSSRALECRSFHLFLSRFVARQSVSLHSQSLLRLIALLDSPRCGPAVQHLDVSLPVRALLEVEHLIAPPISSTRFDPLSGYGPAGLPSPPPSPLDALDEEYGYDEAVQRWHSSTRPLAAEEALLTKALSRISNLQLGHLSINCTGKNYIQWIAATMAPMDDAASLPFEITMRAIFAAGLTVHNLSVFASGTSYIKPRSIRDLEMRYPKQLHPWLANLQSLDLSMATPCKEERHQLGFDDVTTEEDEFEAAGVVRFLTACTSLTRLNLWLEPGASRDNSSQLQRNSLRQTLFSTLVHALPKKHSLTDLTLAHMSVSSKDVALFASKAHPRHSFRRFMIMEKLSASRHRNLVRLSQALLMNCGGGDSTSMSFDKPLETSQTTHRVIQEALAAQRIIIYSVPLCRDTSSGLDLDPWGEEAQHMWGAAENGSGGKYDCFHGHMWVRS